MESSRWRLEAVERCPACGSVGRTLYAGVTDHLYNVAGAWSYSRCSGCCSLWLNPRPIAADIPACYPQTYFTHGAGAPERAERAKPRREGLRRLVLAGALGYRHLHAGNGISRALGKPLARLPFVRRQATHNLGLFMVPYRPEGRLLDVGCGDGSYLATMQRYGWEVAGIEPDGAAAAAARRDFRLIVHPGSLADAPFPPASFDVITARQVLEHIAEPIAFLEAVASLLKPGGRLFLVMPNAASLGHRCFRTNCFSLDPPRHVVLYTVAGVRRLFLQIPSLRVTHVRTNPKIAHKIFKQWCALRRTGHFVSGRLPATRQARLAALGFGLIESAVNRLMPVGEEIELVAMKPSVERMPPA